CFTFLPNPCHSSTLFCAFPPRRKFWRPPRRKSAKDVDSEEDVDAEGMAIHIPGDWLSKFVHEAPSLYRSRVTRIISCIETIEICDKCRGRGRRAVPAKSAGRLPFDRQIGGSVDKQIFAT